MKAVIPIATSLKIEKFSGGVFSVTDSSTRNIIFDRYDNGKLFVTQRPGVNIHDDASATTVDVRGRGIYHWQKTNELYFINNDTVYRGGYSAALVALISAGKERVEFFEIGDYLVILDPENNQGWTINSASPTIITEITDVDFPPKQTPTLQISRGGTALNGALYVMDTAGTIWGSASEDPTTWNALNFITAEIETDGGVALALHHQHIVAFGQRTIEFFYDAGNATGSPLAVRSDIDYNIGAVIQDSVVRIADVLFFIGVAKSGGVGVYAIERFAVKKVSTADIDTMLSSALIVDGMSLLSSGFIFGNSQLYIFTLAFVIGGEYSAQSSYVFNLTNNTWATWDIAHTGYTTFPLVSWSRGKIVRSGEGMTNIGDIVSLADDFNPQDSLLAQVYVLTDYVVEGYISDTSQSGITIPISIQLGHMDNGVRNIKRMDKLRVIATQPENTQNLTVRWSDEDNDSFNDGVVIDMKNNTRRLSRLGRYRQRNVRLEYSGNEQIRIEGVEIDYEVMAI